ncbi:MAG: glutamine synthetase type III, partial [Clostridia bacterium]|nr:glutamine synthetase type III [Clostridia bacterium]
KDPYHNDCFLLMLCAVIAAVDDYQDLLRISVATCGNDYRLGAGEAPPAVISMFLGEDLTGMLEAIETGTEYSAIKAVEMEGAKVLPHFMRDTADRNRTSPFAFTGNKFEFRSLGASLNIAEPNIMLNTIVADALHSITERLDETQDLRSQVCEIVRDTMRAHKRILFNGNNYTNEWVEEAARRGLLNFRSTPEAVPHLCDEKNVALFEKYGVLNRVELNSRMEINSETYGKLLHIEALTMLEMANREIFPGVIAYLSKIAEEIRLKKAVAPGVPCEAEEDLLTRISAFLSDAYQRVKTLEKALDEVAGIAGVVEKSLAYRRLVFPAMTALRTSVDGMEPLVGKEYWAIPTYTELLFSV